MNKTIKAGLGQIMYGAGVHSACLKGHATIVLFHRVDDRLAGNPISATTSEFREFCAFFKRNFDVMSMSALLDRIETGKDISRALVITFDDGYLDNYTTAAPILREFDLPACFYVATNYIASNAVPWWDADIGFTPEWMSWDQVRELVAMGFEIGSHTENHADLGKVEAATAKSEIELSKVRLERELGRRVDLFSYPYGGRQHFTETARQMVKDAGYRSCVSAFGGGVRPGDNEFALQRLPISPWYSSAAQFGFERAVLALRDARPAA